MDTREFATIAKFSSLEAAQVAESMLTSMGVNCQLVNDVAAEVLPMLERDIRLIVNRADLPKALQIMRAKFNKADFKTEWKE